MYKNFKILGIIPARGGSKRISNKNIVKIKKKPLISWTIHESKKSRLLDRIIISTDDSKIAEIATKLGIDVPFKRPKYLSTDTSSSISTIEHAIKKIKGFDYVVLLQPTSPLRLAKDIDNSIEKCIDTNSHSCVSVKELNYSSNLIFFEKGNGHLKPFSNSKKNKKLFVLNGAVYVVKIRCLSYKDSLITNKTVKYLMPEERSIDIDTNSDLKKFKMMLS